MRTLRIVGCIGLLSLQLSACSWTTRTPSVQTKKNEENTKVAQFSSVAEFEYSSKFSIQEKTSQKAVIANLADGNYQFCTKPSANKVISSLEKGWCFVFRKNKNSIVGQYFHSAPKGDRYFCLNGKLKSSMVSGTGYELIFGWDRPITPVDVMSMPQKPTWDWWISEGENLKVSPAYLYATGKDSSGHYGWIRYDKVQLNLSRFYQHKLEKILPPQKCLK